MLLKLPSKIKIHTDYLIIGSGLAGLYSANYASRFGKTIIVSKSNIEISSSWLAQGGIAAAIDEDDSPEYHYNDTLTAGRGLCNKEAVKILVEEGKERVLELIELGFQFDTHQGKLAMGLEGGHSKHRILHAGGDATGMQLVNFFVGMVKPKTEINRFENTVVFKLISDGEKVFGALAYDYEKDEVIQFIAKAVILATGGASGIFTRSTNPHSSTGDGISLAYNAGAEVSSMEFIQFHPTAFYSGTDKTFLISEAVRGEGAYLVNDAGERFVNNYSEQAELAPRDVVAKAIFEELQQSGKSNVYLVLSHLDSKKVKIRFATIFKKAKEFGIDITKDPVPVSPAAHYFIGGIRTNVNGETNLKGLYSCGEAAYTGINGANRLASNSLLECLVFGRRAVDHARDNAAYFPSNFGPSIIPDFRIDRKIEEKYNELKNKASSILTSKVGITRTGEKIKNAVSEFDEIKNSFRYNEYEYYSSRLYSLLDVCRLTAESALIREESRGGHIRSDFPDEDIKFKKVIVHRKNSSPYFIEKNL